MSDVVFGRDMILEVKIDDVYTPVGCAASCNFSFSNELIFKTDVNAGLFRKRRVRISDCSAEVQGLTTLVNDENLSALYFLQEGVRRTEKDLRFRFTDEAGVSKQIQGIFLIQAVTLSGEVSGFSEFDVQLAGTGGFSISEITDESGDTGLPGNVQWDWWPAVEGATSITGPGHYGRSFAGVPFADIIEVDKEGTQFDLVEDLPEGRECTYDGVATISFDPLNPFADGARIFVIWQI